MPDLLHEYWQAEDGGWFSTVNAAFDRVRSEQSPEARRVFSLKAASWFEAMRQHNERLGYEDYKPPAGVPDHVYSDEEWAEQTAYLRQRCTD